MSGGFDLWRAIDAEGGAPDNSDFCRGVNAGLEAASKHVERLGYSEGDIVLPKVMVEAMLTALTDLWEAYDGGMKLPDDRVALDKLFLSAADVIAKAKGEAK